MDTSRLQRARLFVLALIGTGIVLNVVVGQIVRNVLQLPIYLDSIGTILAGALGGPLVGAATGALSNLVWGIIFNDPGIVPYALTAACIGGCAAAAASLGAFKSLPATALAGLITGAIAALVSAPITVYVQHGASGAGTIALREVLASTSDNLLQAATLQGFVSDPLDKALSFLVVFAILRALPPSIQRRFAEAQSFSRSRRLSARYGAAVVLSLLALIFSWVFRPAFGTDVYSIFYLAVVLSAWYGGLGPGLLAGGVGVLTTLAFESPPLGAGLSTEDWLRITIFIAVAFLVALITVRLDRSNSALSGALAETRAVVDGVVEALVLVSPEQRVLSVNHQVETLFSVPTAQVLGRRLDDLRETIERIFAEPDAIRQRFAESVTDQTTTFTQTVNQRWPQERILELFSAPVRSDRGLVGRLYGFRDVTQERELDRMKSEFVSQVSHELRTPLTAIKGFTEMVLDGDAGDVNDEQSEYLGIVKTNVDRLMALINDLLDVARIESGRVQLKLEDVDVAEIVQLVARTMRPLLEGKNQSLRMEVEANLPPARADRDRIVQVLTNLVSNAHKYTPADGAIVVSAGKQDELVRIAVQDNGIGIPQDDIPKLFSRFFRVDSSLTREIGGTGLGLSIVKSIVELHGGTVTVDSAPGSGSTFSFTLPVAVPSETERSVLLVDGEPSVDDLRDALGRVGYHVDVVDAAHALTQSEQHRPDLIVVRLRLANPGCLQEVHSLAEAAERQHIPLLVVSQPGPESTKEWPALDDALVVDRVQHALAESTRRQVLVIEDDASIRRLLSTSLGQRGFETLEAADGETGLRLADERKPDLIVLDLHLPGIDGFTVLQRLKHSPATADTPVIAATGDEGLLLGARARVLSLGASDFVEKPFQMDTLVDEIRALTGAKEDIYAHSRTGR